MAPPFPAGGSVSSEQERAADFLAAHRPNHLHSHQGSPPLGPSSRIVEGSAEGPPTALLSQEHAVQARLNWLQHGRQRLREKRTRVVVVANRLPVTLKKTGDGAGGTKWTGVKSSGGLVTGLSAVRGMDMTWIGWPGCEVPEEDRAQVLALLRSFNCYPVWLSQALITLYYNGFANNVIWPLFHYVMPPLPVHGVTETTLEQWQAYERANEMFTQAIVDVYEPEALIWVQDYHLMLVPRMFRQRVPDAQIGWFLHTPFPASEYYRALKVREELLQGVLSANLVAFHVYDYIRHFLSSVVQLTSLETSPTGVDATPIGGCFVRCATIPIGIEPSIFTLALQEPTVLDQIGRLQEQFGNRKVILGVDRLDYMKGIPHKLRAFDRFLSDHEEWLGECVLVQVAVPSRQDVSEYQKLKKLVHEMVGAICGRHSSLASGPPVVYLDKSIDEQELAALYRIADVCLITSVRDGMNLVSYEFVACQEDKHGVLILSEFAGAVQSLGAGSIRVNPWNLSETAAAIHQALTMGEQERAARHEYAWRTIHKYTAQKWAETFIQTLKESSLECEEFTARVPPLLPYEEFLEEMVASKKRLLLIDLLDCLVPSKRKKDLPMKLYQSLLVVPSQVLQCLAALAHDADTTVVLVTMHQKGVMERLFGHLPVILAAENGCLYRGLDGEWRSSVDPETRANCDDWMDGCMDIFDYFKERTPGSYTERAEYSVTWYYDNTQADFGAQQARELLIYLWAGPLMNSAAEVVPGTKAVVVRPHGTSRANNLVTILKRELGTSKLEEIDWAACFAEVPFRDDAAFEALEDLLTDCQVDSPGNNRMADADSDAADLGSAGRVGGPYQFHHGAPGYRPLRSVREEEEQETNPDATGDAQPYLRGAASPAGSDETALLPLAAACDEDEPLRPKTMNLDCDTSSSAQAGHQTQHQPFGETPINTPSSGALGSTATSFTTTSAHAPISQIAQPGTLLTQLPKIVGNLDATGSSTLDFQQLELDPKNSKLAGTEEILENLSPSRGIGVGGSGGLDESGGMEVVVMVNNEMCFDMSQLQVNNEAVEAPPPGYFDRVNESLDHDASGALVGADGVGDHAAAVLRGGRDQTALETLQLQEAEKAALETRKDLFTTPQSNVVLVPTTTEEGEGGAGGRGVVIACIIPPRYDAFQDIVDALPATERARLGVRSRREEEQLALQSGAGGVGREGGGGDEDASASERPSWVSADRQGEAGRNGENVGAVGSAGGGASSSAEAPALAAASSQREDADASLLPRAVALAPRDADNHRTAGAVRDAASRSARNPQEDGDLTSARSLSRVFSKNGGTKSPSASSAAIQNLLDPGPLSGTISTRDDGSSPHVGAQRPKNSTTTDYSNRASSAPPRPPDARKRHAKPLDDRVASTVGDPAALPTRDRELEGRGPLSKPATDGERDDVASEIVPEESSSVGTPEYPHDDRDQWPAPDPFEAPPGYARPLPGHLLSSGKDLEQLRQQVAASSGAMVPLSPDGSPQSAPGPLPVLPPLQPLVQSSSGSKTAVATVAGAADEVVATARSPLSAPSPTPDHHAPVAISPPGGGSAGNREAGEEEFPVYKPANAYSSDGDSGTLTANKESAGGIQRDHQHNASPQQGLVSYFGVSLGKRPSRARYSLPNPYHVQNLLQSMVERLPECTLREKEKSRAVLVGPEGEGWKSGS